MYLSTRAFYHTEKTRQEMKAKERTPQTHKQAYGRGIVSYAFCFRIKTCGKHSAQISISTGCKFMPLSEGAAICSVAAYVRVRVLWRVSLARHICHVIWPVAGAAT